MATLTVEDSTGVPLANSYISAADAGTYHVSRGTYTEWDTVVSAGAVEGMLIDATRLIDQSVSWLGTIATTTQGLGLPRYDITLPDGRVVDAEAQIAIAADATAQLALRLYQDRPATTLGVKSESLPDYSVVYDLSKIGQYPEIDLILGPIVDGGGLGGGFQNVKLVRWS